MAKKEIPEFSLDDILNEFHVDPEPAKEAPQKASPQPEKSKFDTLTRLDMLLSDTAEAGTEDSPDIPPLPPQEENAGQAPAATAEQPKADRAADPLDDLDALLEEFSGAAPETDDKTAAADQTLRFEPVISQTTSPEETPDPTISEDSTIRIDNIITDLQDHTADQKPEEPPSSIIPAPVCGS